VLLGVAVVAVSTSAPLVRGAEAPRLALAFWRIFLALPVTGGLLLLRDRGGLRRLRGDLRRRSVLAGVLLAAHFATWIPSLSYTSVASSVALVSTTPVWAALVLRRRGVPVAPAAWRGIVVALAGVVVLTGVDVTVTPRALAGDLLALAGGVFAALYLVAGADVRQHLSTAAYTTVCYAVAAVVTVVVCLVGRQALVGYPADSWLAIAGMAVGPQLLGHTVLNRVVRTIDPTAVSVAILGEILGAALLAWLFFDEVPPASAVPAGVLVAAGVVMVIRSGPTTADEAAGAGVRSV
jgi:drug/metabolite transporter (DMT)-like permease